jgi:hypothetical protein
VTLVSERSREECVKSRERMRTAVRKLDDPRILYNWWYPNESSQLLYSRTDYVSLASRIADASGFAGDHRG